MWIGWCWIVPSSLPSISRFAWPTIEPPGVYSSFTIFRGPAWSVKPERSKINVNINQFKAIYHPTYPRWYHSLIVVGIHANGIAFEVERELAVLHVLQLVLMQVRPAPDASIYNMRKAFTTSYLQTSIKRPLDSDAFAWMSAICCYCGDERVKFIAFFLQLLHQRLDRSLRKAFRFSPLLDCRDEKQQQIVKIMQK